jgi:uncharacterized protein (DUF736 family)
MIIGKFIQQGEVYAGNLYGIGFTIPHVVFGPVSAKQGNGPDFVVTGAPQEDKPATELGAAWAKTSKAGNAYLSVKLDSPVLVTPINGALTRQQDGSYALVWNRKEAKAGELPAEAEIAA